MDAALEVPVAGQDRRHRKVAVVDRLGHPGEQGARVADAGGAAEPDQVEPDLGQGLGEAGPVEVVHHHP